MAAMNSETLDSNSFLEYDCHSFYCISDIHKIVEGNFILRSSVKDRPVLLGNKLRQHYFKVSLICRHVWRRT